MNQAIFWVIPMARGTSQLLMPFLQFTICHMAISHLSRPMGESSKMVPVFKVNCGASCFSRQCQRLYFSRNSDVLGAATGAGHAIGPAPRYQVIPAVGWIGKVYDGLLKSVGSCSML